MQEKASWRWTHSGIHGEHHGYVDAVDPRDALSRALSAKSPSGLLFGEELDIPVDVLVRAPANADPSYSARGLGYSITVSKCMVPA